MSEANLNAHAEGGRRRQEKGKGGEEGEEAKEEDDCDLEWGTKEEREAHVKLEGATPTSTTVGSCRVSRELHRARVDRGEVVALGDETAFRHWLGKLRRVQVRACVRA